jgi:hypothetical protein
MSSSRLALPTAPETSAFRAVVAVVRRDPDLRRIGLVVRAWDGRPEDLAAPTPAQLPWLRLTPAPGDSGWESEGQHRASFLVHLELAVAGTNTDSLLDLWAALRTALFPTDPTRRSAVRALLLAAGITQGTLTQQPFRVKTLDGNQHALAATGALKLTLMVST